MSVVDDNGKWTHLFGLKEYFMSLCPLKNFFAALCMPQRPPVSGPCPQEPPPRPCPPPPRPCYAKPPSPCWPEPSPTRPLPCSMRSAEPPMSIGYGVATTTTFVVGAFL
ncbi:MAG TPA: hypothetical protein DCE36_02395 [Pseudomonas sp.]|nr:hypothetical protein [Pseudomonas sp.]